MQTQKNKIFGVLVMFVCILVFFFLFAYFKLDGASLSEATLTELLKMIVTTAFLPAGLYLGLYFYSGKKLANQIGGGATLFLIAAYILGLLLHR